MADVVIPQVVTSQAFLLFIRISDDYFNLNGIITVDYNLGNVFCRNMVWQGQKNLPLHKVFALRY